MYILYCKILFKQIRYFKNKWGTTTPMFADSAFWLKIHRFSIGLFKYWCFLSTVFLGQWRGCNYISVVDAHTVCLLYVVLYPLLCWCDWKINLVSACMVSCNAVQGCFLLCTCILKGIKARSAVWTLVYVC